jgi:hypothetical protein
MFDDEQVNIENRSGLSIDFLVKSGPLASPCSRRHEHEGATTQAISVLDGQRHADDGSGRPLYICGALGPASIAHA